MGIYTVVMTRNEGSERWEDEFTDLDGLTAEEKMWDLLTWYLTCLHNVTVTIFGFFRNEGCATAVSFTNTPLRNR